MSELPRGWAWTTLGAIAEIVGGVTKDSKRQNQSGLVEVPYLRVANVQRGWLDLDNVAAIRVPPAKAEALRLQPGDVLFNEGGDRDKLGRGWVWDGQIPDCIHQNHVFRARLHSSDVLPKFLSHYGNSVGSRWFESAGRQTTNLASISLTALRKLPIPMPPAEEQRKIVEILEGHLSRLDAGTEGVTRSLQRLGLWEAVALQAVLGEESSGRVKLASLIHRIEAGRSYGGPARRADADEWGIIKVSAMTWGKFRPDENKAVPPEAINKRFEIRPGDLLLSRANTTSYVGASVLVDDTRPRLLLSDKSLRLVPVSNVDVRWLAAALAAPDARRQISVMATGTKDSMRNISQENLLSIMLPAASAEQQQRVVHRRQDITSRSRRAEAQFRETVRRAASLRRSVLAAAFSGRLTERSSDIEVVEEMAGV
jgi:restriction endonuclease S subunit